MSVLCDEAKNIDVVGLSSSSHPSLSPGFVTPVLQSNFMSEPASESTSMSNLTLIFERLRSYGLQLKSSKCHLFRVSVPFLGHIVGRRGLDCDPTKIEDVKSWPVPDCLKSVRQFLGFVGYYRRFIPKFADIATPLVYLTSKDVPFVWDSSCSAAFRELRAALIDAPILAFPTETGQYILDTDASNFGLGGVLSQIQNDQERVVAYCSRALRPSQRRYCTTKREMLAVVPCAYSLDHTCVEHVLLSGRIISRWCGYIALKIRRACCPDGYIPCNNSSFPLYTGLGRITGMLMAFHALHHHHVDSTHAQTAHRPYTTTQTNHSTLSRRAARRMQI